MKKLVSVLSIALLLVSYAYADCKTVPVITGEFATETLFDPTKTQVKYEKVCSKPAVTTGEFVVDPLTLETKKGNAIYQPRGAERLAGGSARSRT